jgi:hypothetical protein
MTRHQNSLAIAAALLMAAAVQPATALAQSVTVKVADRPEAAVREDIQRAAHQVCSDDRDFQLGLPREVEAAQCERLTVRKAMIEVARAAEANRLALNSRRQHGG